MKKIVIMFITLCVCIGLYACASTAPTETTEPIETIGERPLINDTVNPAKALLNLGKGTTIHGIITDITTSYCTIKLIHPKNAFVHVEMPIEQLAELHENLFISIEGIVSGFDLNGDGIYTISADHILDVEEMDTWVKERISGFYNYNGASIETYCSIIDEFDLGLLHSYAEIRGDMFKITDATQLSEYLVGRWIYSTTPDKWWVSRYWIFSEDGSYEEENSGYTSPYCDYGNWNVNNGELEIIPSGEYGFSAPVYVFGDDIFIYYNFYERIVSLYIRDKALN